jgi:hypothetical protein
MIEQKELCLLKKNEPLEFFENLYLIWREEHRQDGKKLPELIVQMNKKDGVDFCLMATTAINEGFDCFNVSHILEEALPELNLNIDTFLKLAECLFNAMKNDMASFIQFKSIKSLVNKQPIFSRELLTELLKQDAPYAVGYISNIYINLSIGHEHEIHNELCSLKAHKSKYVLMAVVNALGALNYRPSANQSLIKATLTVLNELESKNSDEINSNIIYSYMNLLDYSEEPKNKFIEFSKSSQPLIQYPISRVLFLTQEKHGNEGWFSIALFNLTSASCSNKGIIDNIDYILAGFIEKSDNWDLAENFFTSWLLDSEYISNNNRLSELYGSTLPAFINRSKNFERLLTRFFNHDNFKVHSAAAEMISYCQLHKVSPFKFNKQLLKPLSYADCLYICRKVLGYVTSPEYLCSLCFSILDKSPKNKEIQGLIYSIFKNHIGENHPNKTIEFLKKASLETKSVNKKRVADQIVADMEKYFSQKESLSSLNELAPPKQRSQKITLENNKQMKTAMDEAQKNSIVSMISSKIILKQGTGSFHFFDGKYSEISKLGSYSTGMEIPNTEITHPVDAALERMGFRMAKRGQ